MLKKTVLSLLTAGVMGTSALAQAQSGLNDNNTTTPIKHLIVVVGENHSFDSLFATYQPQNGQHVKNLLSEGIIKADGSPGPNFNELKQSTAKDTGSTYTLEPQRTGAYWFLPQPVWELGIPDLRFPWWMRNGPFQITKYIPYSGITAVGGDPVHRFFQMWQQTGGTNSRHDLFAWVAKTTGQGGDTPLVTKWNPGQGGEEMGFYNMAQGDAPYFKQLADQYAISDNYHQAVMGGTGMNFYFMTTGDLPVYNINGQLATPPANQIENPNPASGTANFYTRDGYHGGSYVDCSDPSQPGVEAIVNKLEQAGVNPHCASGAYYLVNNYSLPYDVDGNPQPLGANSYVFPPQDKPTIAGALAAHHVSWKWYTGGRNAADLSQDILGQKLGGLVGEIDYNNLGDPLVASRQIENSPLRQNLQGLVSFYRDLNTGDLPAVSYVVPPNISAGHPGNSAPAYYEDFVGKLIKSVQSKPGVWAHTAIIVTTDEGGGFFDTGPIQMLDFFGDGPRIPLFVVSPYAKKGYVSHVYNDHVSILKFIERNWHLSPLSSRSRDRLPDPVMTRGSYLPANGPAIGDLMSLFSF